MTPRFRMLFALSAALLLTACEGPSGVASISYPVLARGEDAAAFDAGSWSVTLTTAEVGFGPSYFCATAAASAELCSVATSEFADTGVVNALSSEPQVLGEAQGETGTLRSVTYDFAYSWFATESQARVASTSARGHSAYFEGTATQGSTTVPFTVAIDLPPRIRGTRAVQGQRLDATLTTRTRELVVTVQPTRWFSRVVFDDLVSLSPAGETVTIAPGSRAYEALVLAMTVNAPPSFQWNE